MEVGKIVTAIAKAFELNPAQETELLEYAELEQSKWIKEQKTEQEIEEMLKIGAEYIIRK